MMIRNLLCLTICLGSVIGFSGCLLNVEKHTVLRQDEPVYPIAFESEAAKAAFDAQVETAVDKRGTSNASVGIPFILGVSHSRKVSSNAVRNDVAARWDVNGDRMISDSEMSIVQQIGDLE